MSKIEKSTIDALNALPMQDVAAALGLEIAVNGKHNIRYRNPFINDVSGNWNLRIDANKMKEFDNANGTLNNIDLVKIVKGCDFLAAVEYLSDLSPAEITRTSDYSTARREVTPYYTLHDAKPYEAGKYTHHDAYWQGRGLGSMFGELHQVVLKTETGKFLHFSGFRTGATSYELRMPPSEKYPKSVKLCFGTKSVTHIDNFNGKVAVYEGFTDYLAHKALWRFHGKIYEQAYDVIILNSTALVAQAIERIADYEEIYAFFDNDSSGTEAYEVIDEALAEVGKDYKIRDMRVRYSQYNDLNDWWVENSSKFK